MVRRVGSARAAKVGLSWSAGKSFNLLLIELVEHWLGEYIFSQARDSPALAEVEGAPRWKSDRQRVGSRIV